MRKLITLILPILLLSSCIKYEEPTLVSLSGEYIIDKITLTNVEDTSTIYQDVYLPGDVFLDNLASSPMDSIVCGLTRWHFDYSVVSFNPTFNPDGSVTWGEQYFYNYEYPLLSYDYGYVNINMLNSRLIFKLIDDQAESLTFRTTGKWTINNSLKEVSVTLQLTRVGP